MTGHVLITGPGSAIARALAERVAAGKPAKITLATRDVVETERTAADLRIRFNVEVAVVQYDAAQASAAAGMVARCADVEVAIICHGTMPSEADVRENEERLREMIGVNFVSVAALVERLIDSMTTRGTGTICVLGSVAGDRGRQSNYAYGSTKAALDCYLEGVRHRLARTPIRVVTIKPGIVDTAMTWGLPLPPVVASPQRVARDIERAVRRGKPLAYTPFFWRWIMLAIRSTPRVIFYRTKL